MSYCVTMARVVAALGRASVFNLVRPMVGGAQVDRRKILGELAEFARRPGAVRVQHALRLDRLAHAP